uniref:Uncharacterized protein n=1 Tax=Oryza barthii TaxID=65489 RepID=A0A0D3GF14_9ORYZ
MSQLPRRPKPESKPPKDLGFGAGSRVAAAVAEQGPERQQRRGAWELELARRQELEQRRRGAWDRVGTEAGTRAAALTACGDPVVWRGRWRSAGERRQ